MKVKNYIDFRECTYGVCIEEGQPDKNNLSTDLTEYINEGAHLDKEKIFFSASWRASNDYQNLTIGRIFLKDIEISKKLVYFFNKNKG